MYRKLAFVFLVFSASLLCTQPALANNVTVDCSGQTPGAFTRLQAAIDSLDLTGPHFISVKGTCTENITILNRDRLDIFGASGQPATINAADPNGVVITSINSRAITLLGLVIQGGGTGVSVGSSQLQMGQCTIQNNSGDGIDVQGSSMYMESSTIQNNGGSGLVESGGSNVTFTTTPEQRVHIVGNGGDGIDIDGSFLQVNFGNLDVENNAGAAITQFGGRLLVFGGPSENLFQGNGEGIDVLNAGSANFFGKNTIRNNGDVGLQVSASAVAFNGGIRPDGSLNATTIEGHTTVGVNVVQMGHLTMNGPHKIQNNGSAAADPDNRGGIRLNRSSLTLRGGVQVNNNVGPGIRTLLNTGLSLANASVTGNSEQGVILSLQSVGGFTLPFTISGNGTASISCDTTSLAFGDLAGVTNLDCSRIERQHGPPRSGKVLN